MLEAEKSLYEFMPKPVQVSATGDFVIVYIQY